MISEVTRRSRQEMHDWRNYLLHGIYLTLYAPLKYMAFPLFNYLRFAVLKLFSKGIHATYISDGVQIWFPWRVTIGRRSSLNQGIWIDGFGGVSIGENVRIAAYTIINTADHDFSDSSRPIVEQGFVTAPVYIEDDVWIGSGTIINKGVRIGRGSVIGAGSVVLHDIPPQSVAVGSPCKVIRRR